MKTIAALFLLLVSVALAEEKKPAFRPQTIDGQIEIGYNLAIADVDGDGKPDILLADAKQIVWYKNPSWTKHVIAENLTVKDNVCIAARDIDGDGKCEIAVGAEWDPGDTVNSGSVFYLIPPADRTQKWEAVKFQKVEPTTHRMKWVRRGDNEDDKPRYDLVVVPLHGRGNKNGEGEGVKVLAYQMPKNPKDEWKSEVVSNEMHMMHNFDVVKNPDNPDDEFEKLLLGGREGLSVTDTDEQGWNYELAVSHPDYPSPLPGVGEIRMGVHPSMDDEMFVVSIEPMHGSTLALYTETGADSDEKTPRRDILDTTLDNGHALACGDLLGLGHDQVVVGWRGAPNNMLARVGIKMFVPDEEGRKWTQHLIDDNTMACEDLVLADLNGDGKLDIIASGRRTKNVMIYWNENQK